MAKAKIKSLIGPDGSTIFPISDYTAIQGKNGQALSNNIATMDAAISANATNISGLQTTVGGHTTAITELQSDVAQNTSDISSLQTAINEKEHFRGYFATTAEIQVIQNPSNGDYAYNAQTGTKWAYNGTAWEDTKVPVPDQTTPLSDQPALMDGTAAAGTSSSAARGDHVHPTDTTRASASALTTLTGRVTTLETDSANTVKVTAQSLTPSEQSQARTNIGAGTSNFSGSYNDLSDIPVGLVNSTNSTLPDVDIFLS